MTRIKLCPAKNAHSWAYTSKPVNRDQGISLRQPELKSARPRISNRRFPRLIVCGQSVPPCILALPVETDRLGRIIQPIGIGEQRDQFDGAKELHRVGTGLAERPQFPGAGKNGNVLSRAVQELCHLSRQEAGREVFGCPGCQGCLNHVVAHNVARSLSSAVPSPIRQTNLDIGILQGAFAGCRRAGAPRPPAATRPRNPVKFDTRHNSFGVKSTYPVFVAAGELNHSGCWYAPFSGNGSMNDLRSL